MIFAGLDPTASLAKRTAAAVVDESGEVLGTAALGSDAEILDWIEAWLPRGLELVGFDGPLALPEGLSEEAFARGEEPGARRLAELELARRGIGCFFTTSRSFAKPWALRCVKLGRKIAGAGFRVVEVYPHASKVRLWGRNYPRPKGRREVRKWLLDALRELGLKWQPASLPGHDELDAVVAAVTACLVWRGLVEWVGKPEPAIALPLDRRELPETLFPKRHGRRTA